MTIVKVTTQQNEKEEKPNALTVTRIAEKINRRERASPQKVSAGDAP